ncbi:MAG: hypothetical protein WAL71_18680 [Terriglobales bacterium]
MRLLVDIIEKGKCRGKDQHAQACIRAEQCDDVAAMVAQKFFCAGTIRNVRLPDPESFLLLVSG